MSSAVALPAPGAECLALDDRQQFLDFAAVDGVGAHADLEPVELGRVVASRHHDPPARVEMAHGEIEDGRCTGADIDDIDPARKQPRFHGGGKGFGTEAAVAAQRHGFHTALRCIGADGPADAHDDIGRQVPFDQTPDVIFPEYFTVHDSLPSKKRAIMCTTVFFRRQSSVDRGAEGCLSNAVRSG